MNKNKTRFIINNRSNNDEIFKFEEIYEQMWVNLIDGEENYVKQGSAICGQTWNYLHFPPHLIKFTSFFHISSNLIKSIQNGSKLHRFQSDYWY